MVNVHLTSKGVVERVLLVVLVHNVLNQTKKNKSGVYRCVVLEKYNKDYMEKMMPLLSRFLEGWKAISCQTLIKSSCDSAKS